MPISSAPITGQPSAVRTPAPGFLAHASVANPDRPARGQRRRRRPAAGQLRPPAGAVGCGPRAPAAMHLGRSPRRRSARCRHAREAASDGARLGARRSRLAWPGDRRRARAREMAATSRSRRGGRAASSVRRRRLDVDDPTSLRACAHAITDVSTSCRRLRHRPRGMRLGVVERIVHGVVVVVDWTRRSPSRRRPRCRAPAPRRSRGRRASRARATAPGAPHASSSCDASSGRRHQQAVAVRAARQRLLELAGGLEARVGVERERLLHDRVEIRRQPGHLARQRRHRLRVDLLGGRRQAGVRRTAARR